MQQAVLCYFTSTQICLLLCLHNRGVHCEIHVYSFKELIYSGPDTAGTRLSCIYAVSVWRPLRIQRLFFSRFYTSVILFLLMSGTPVPYRHFCMSGTPVPYKHFCLCQAHQCLTDIFAYVRYTSVLQTFLNVSGTPVPYRHFCICQERQCLSNIFACQAHQCHTDITFISVLQ